MSNLYSPLINQNNIQISISEILPTTSFYSIPSFGSLFNHSINNLINQPFSQSYNQPFGQLQMNQLISSQNNLMNIPNNLFNNSENFLYIVYEF